MRRDHSKQERRPRRIFRITKGEESETPPVDGNPIEIVIKKLYRFLNLQLGWRLAALLLVLVSTWYNWDKITHLPGAREAITYFRELIPLPKANPERFSVAIARLENDRDGVHRRLIRDALLEQFGKNEVEVILFDRLIEVGDSDQPQVAIREGHKAAEKMLSYSNAQVLIWGEALNVSVDAPMRLHWTTNIGMDLDKTTDKYQPVSDSYDLPELFHNDLNDVLVLLTRRQAASLSEQDGKFTADSLAVFIQRVKNLAKSTSITGIQKSSLQAILGDSLVAYGEQSGDADSLHDAESSYRDALTKLTREGEPQLWSEAQCNLATILALLGRREAGTEKLKEAVKIYQNVLAFYPKTLDPLSWIAMKNNLGAILLSVGERESDPAAVEMVMTAFQEVLAEPGHILEWARTKNNVGTALVVLSKYGDRSNRLELAVEAYKEALQERTRERVPLAWASTQNSLGSALYELGQYGTGTLFLEQAISAFHEALKERTSERVPSKWASTQNNLGVALVALGRRTSVAVYFEQAVSAQRAALTVYSRKKSPLEWATSQNNLGTALTFLGESEGGVAHLEEAVEAYREALKERNSETVLLQWAATQKNLGYALFKLGVRQRNKMLLGQSVSAYQSVLIKLSPAEDPSIFNMVSYGIEEANGALSNLQKEN